MSEIDKLINEAFPDELRNVEPVQIDDSAILCLTLHKLGLDEPASTASARHMRGRKGNALRQRRFIEAPSAPVRSLWISRAGWAAAACVLLAAVLRFVPWTNIFSGYRVEMPGASVRAAVSEAPSSEDSFSELEQENKIVTQSAPRTEVAIGEADPNITVEHVDVDENSYGNFFVYLNFVGMSSAEIGQYVFIAADSSYEILRYAGISVFEGSASCVTFNKPFSGDNMVSLFIFKPELGEDGKFEYKLIRTFQIFLENGDFYSQDDSISGTDLYDYGLYPGSKQYMEANSASYNMDSTDIMDSYSGSIANGMVD